MIKPFLAVLLLSIGSAAAACQGNDDERPPTNIEQIERADLVVLGRVDPERAADPKSPGIGLTPIRILKGQAPEKLVLYGTMRDREGQLVQPSPSGLHGYHPSSSWGSCDREAYAPESLVIAAFVKTLKGYFQLGDRGVEDVQGTDDIWVRAAALYAQIIRSNPAPKRRRAFKIERDRLFAISGDPDARMIAEDIDHYLRATAK